MELDFRLDPFQYVQVPFGAWTQSALDWLVSVFRGPLLAIKQPIQWLFRLFEDGLRAIPPEAGLTLVGLIGWQCVGLRGALWSVGAFAVIVALANQGRDSDRVEDFAGLARTRPGLAGLMALFMVALAGIPGTAGFIAKFTIFSAAVKSGAVALTIIAVLTSVVSVYYYLRVPVMMYMREPGDVAPRADLASGEFVVLAVCAFFVLLLGVFPNEAPTDVLAWIRALDWSRSTVALLD